MNINVYHQSFDTENYTIVDSYAKAIRRISDNSTILCSISGGSDSDIVLDIIHNVDNSGKVAYYWIDTGLEYQSIKDHFEYLESKYNIQIERIKPKKSIPTCVREYGIPFISKYVS